VTTLLTVPLLGFWVPLLTGLLIFVIGLSALGAYLSVKVLRRTRLERDTLVNEKEVIFNYVQTIADTFTESETLDPDRILDRVLYHALRTTRTGGGAIYLIDEGNVLHAHAVSGVFPPMFSLKNNLGGLDPRVLKNEQVEQMTRSTPIAVGEGLVGQAADFGTPMLVSHAELDPRVPHFDSSLLNVRSLLIVPMRFRHEVMGVICVVNRVDGVPLSERDQSLLQALADQASLSIYYARFRAALDEKQRMDQDLNLAHRIQQRLLPEELPEIKGLNIDAFNLAAQEVGGDYYDVIPIDDRYTGIAVADVSGKGVGGALMMSICRSVLRAHAGRNPDPAAVMREVNRTMIADISEDMFVTMMYMVYDAQTRELAMARAGHDPTLILQPDSEEVLRRESEGMAIGLVDSEIFDDAIETTRVILQPGALVVCYTDGITEAMNDRHEEWGVAPLSRILVSNRTLSPHQVLQNIRERVLRFVGDMPQYDDMTLMVFRVDT